MHIVNIQIFELEVSLESLLLVQIHFFPLIYNMLICVDGIVMFSNDIVPPID